MTIPKFLLRPDRYSRVLKFFTVSSPLVLGKALHRFSTHESNDQRRARLRFHAICRVGKATDFYFAACEKGYPSGFSRLAESCATPGCDCRLDGAASSGTCHRCPMRSHHWRPHAMRVKDRIRSFSARVRKLPSHWCEGLNRKPTEACNPSHGCQGSPLGRALRAASLHRPRVLAASCRRPEARSATVVAACPAASKRRRWMSLRPEGRCLQPRVRTSGVRRRR